MNKPIKTISADEHEALIETMRDTVGSQDEPKVGLFWYDPKQKCLTGVKDAYASELSFNAKGRKTVKALHAKVWGEIRGAAIDSGIAQDLGGVLDEYTQVPRGRIFQVDRMGTGGPYFEVLVGGWIHEYPEAAGIIVDQFNLGDADFDFIESHHWNIGCGTSEIFLSE